MKEEVKYERRDAYDDDALYAIFQKHNLRHKRMISWSKSGYWKRFPYHDIMFNANIFTPSGIWWNGDLDITVDNFAIQKLCDDLGEELIIVAESLGWQGAEEQSYEELFEHAHAYFTPNKRYYHSRKYNGIHGVTRGNMTIITSKPDHFHKVRVKKWSQSRRNYNRD